MVLIHLFIQPIFTGHLLCTLEKEMATHSSILAWEIPWTGACSGYSPWIHKRIKHDLATKQQHVPGTGQSIRHTAVNKTAWNSSPPGESSKCLGNNLSLKAACYRGKWSGLREFWFQTQVLSTITHVNLSKLCNLLKHQPFCLWNGNGSILPKL